MTQQTFSKRTDILDELEQIGIGESFLPELYQMLAGIQLLQDFDGHEIESLARYCGGYRAAKGTIIFEEGKKSDSYVSVGQGFLKYSQIKQ